MKTCGAILVITLAMGCDFRPKARTGVPARTAIENVFQARLPSSVTNARVWSGALMTLIVQGRFECSEEDLQEFLAASALLPDRFEEGKNPLENYQDSRFTWWEPGSLENPSGIRCDWDTGPDVATCTLAAGHNRGSDLITVYFKVVYENKNQAGGHRPTVKANPNWQAKAETTPDKAGTADSD